MNPAQTGNPESQQPVECKACIEAVLSSLAFRYRDSADYLLDLKLDTSRRTNPGACIQTFFRLADRLPSTALDELHAIRVWLEGLIEVIALKKDKEFFLRRSISLKSDSLEQCCAAVMQDFRQVTSQSPCDLELQFAFRA